MLILTRKYGESIIIGDDITITVLDNNRQKGQEISIAIEAPADVKILRSEIANSAKKSSKNVANGCNSYIINSESEAQQAKLPPVFKKRRLINRAHNNVIAN